MHKWIYDTVIIGAGMAGLGAAVYAGRFQMKTAVVGETLGGTIILTNDVANYPGFAQTTGLDLAEKLRSHVNDYEVQIVEKVVTKIERCPEGCFKVFTGKEYLHPRSIIFATGTEWRKLDVPGEREFANKGVHYCALCDGALYKDKIIGVVGGSDSAAKEALLLAEYGKRVYIIYRKEKIRPEPINLERVMNHKKIKIINNTSVTAINGDKFIRDKVPIVCVARSIISKDEFVELLNPEQFIPQVNQKSLSQFLKQVYYYPMDLQNNMTYSHFAEFISRVDRTHDCRGGSF